jgi:hypothetical protein
MEHLSKLKHNKNYVILLISRVILFNMDINSNNSNVTSTTGGVVTPEGFNISVIIKEKQAVNSKEEENKIEWVYSHVAHTFQWFHVCAVILHDPHISAMHQIHNNNATTQSKNSKVLPSSHEL